MKRKTRSIKEQCRERNSITKSERISGHDNGNRITSASVRSIDFSVTTNWNLDKDQDGEPNYYDTYMFDKFRSTPNVTIVYPETYTSFDERWLSVNVLVTADVFEGFEGYLAWTTGNFNVEADRSTADYIENGIVTINVSTYYGNTYNVKVGLVDLENNIITTSDVRYVTFNVFLRPTARMGN